MPDMMTCGGGVFPITILPHMTDLNFATSKVSSTSELYNYILLQFKTIPITDHLLGFVSVAYAPVCRHYSLGLRAQGRTCLHFQLSPPEFFEDCALRMLLSAGLSVGLSVGVA